MNYNNYYLPLCKKMFRYLTIKTMDSTLLFTPRETTPKMRPNNSLFELNARINRFK